MKIELGKTYITRDGEKARIICTDRGDRKYPVVALVDNTHMRTYTEAGLYRDEMESPDDLIEEYSPWNDVTVDTPVWVRFWPSDSWHPRHFDHYKDGKVFVFYGGRTKHSKAGLSQAAIEASLTRPCKDVNP